jgi:DNA-binding response OmpR family regulator
MKILLLEDNLRLNSTITKRLREKGFEVDSFSDGEEANNAIDNGYGCYVLDINVPSLNGIELLKNIREYYPKTPVIIISSSIELEAIKDSYFFGCNDYIKKPFYIDELEIKIEKLCNAITDTISFGDNYIFDAKSSILEHDNKRERLSKKERLLLELFLSDLGKVVSYDKIQSIVWEGNFASLDSIRSLIRRVRKKIPESYIETVVDIGYLFNPDKK